jgi:hypothetical protein
MSGANSIILGNVSFGPARSLWEEQPSLRELYDQACQGLVRAECEVEELRAEVAMKQEQARIMAEERDEAREALKDANESVVTFCVLWAFQYAADHGFPNGHIHPTHYDILKKAGAPMNDFARFDFTEDTQ